MQMTIFPDLELEYDHSKILSGETNTENLPGFVLLLSVEELTKRKNRCFIATTMWA